MHKKVAEPQEFANEVPTECIIIEQTIGEGEFGRVCCGRLINYAAAPNNCRVAFKTLKPGSSEKNKIDFLMEASIMGQFDHPNVIRLIGVVSRQVKRRFFVFR